MSRRAYVALSALLAIAVVPVAIADAHQGNPNFRSEVADAPEGVGAAVLNYDDALELRVEPGHEAVVLGYEDEPYVRVLADGTVQINRRSPAAYLNDDRYADVEVPAVADASAPPDWQDEATHGTYAWHDHRIHYMAQGTPPAVEDESRETKVFDWSVPLQVDGSDREITGTLTWVPEGGGPTTGVLIGLALAVLGSFAAFVWAMRRRGRGSGGGDPTRAGQPEAW